MGYRREELTPEELDDCYSEVITNEWSIGLSSKYNPIFVLYPTGLVAINANDFNVLPEVFWDATKKLIDDTLNSRASTQMELLKEWLTEAK